jgi:hypothetical protein
MIRVKVLDPHDIKRQFQELPDRLESVRHAMGSLIAERLRDEVRAKIPGRQGWLGHYYNAIEFHFDGKQWAVGAEASVPIKTLEATTTYITFSGDDPQTAILAEYNPWVIHMIPAISQPYRGRMRVTSANPSDVEAAEKRLSELLPTIKQRLNAAGFAVQKDGIPVLGGVATADLRHLALQLEYGRPPYENRPSPHWRAATTAVSNTIAQSYHQVRSKFEGILKGEIVSQPKPMSSSLRSLISGSRQVPLPRLS